MKISPFLIFFACLYYLSSCNSETTTDTTDEITVNKSSDLQVDHFNIWVKDPEKAKKLLTDIGFTAVPDSLSAIHEGQGTSGRYFNFLNTYLELIFVYNPEEFEANNRKNSGLDFTERADFEKNGASPFGVALKVKGYDVEKIPFETIKYHQAWMEERANIFSAKNSKTHLKEPSIFVVYPEIEALTFESSIALDEMPSDDDSWKTLFKHSNGAKMVTNIVITTPSANFNTETMVALGEIDNISVKKGSEHLMEIYFDNESKGKSFDLRPELPLVIYL